MKNSMSFVRFSCLIAALAALPSVCHALPYFGTFTQTITGTNIPELYVGTEYYGYYSYESDTMDGTFATPTYFDYGSPPTNRTLNGFIFVPFASHVDTGWNQFDWGPGPEWSTLQNTSQSGIITIENGQVTDFRWSHENGGFYVAFGFSSFSAISFYDSGYMEGYEGNRPFADGTIEFTGGPRVPDLGSSIWMLALACLGLGLARRKVCNAAG